MPTLPASGRLPTRSSRRCATVISAAPRRARPRRPAPGRQRRTAGRRGADPGCPAGGRLRAALLARCPLRPARAGERRRGPRDRPPETAHRGTGLYVLQWQDRGDRDDFRPRTPAARRGDRHRRLTAAYQSRQARIARQAPGPFSVTMRAGLAGVRDGRARRQRAGYMTASRIRAGEGPTALPGGLRPRFLSTASKSRATARPCPHRSFTAEAVKLSLPHASEERVPFAGGEAKNRAIGVLAVANADLALGQVRHLDAVTVGETQRTLNPLRI